MDREVLVYVDLDGVQHLTGRLWSRTRKGRETPEFRSCRRCTCSTHGITRREASVGRAVSTWRDDAARLGLTTAEISRMASAFEHADLKEAVSLNA